MKGLLKWDFREKGWEQEEEEGKLKRAASIDDGLRKMRWMHNV